MFKKISDEVFNNALVKNEIDQETFYNLTEQQKEIMKKYDAKTFSELDRNTIGKTITIEEFESFKLPQLDLLYKVDQAKYNELQAEHEKLQEGRNKLYNNRMKYDILLRRKGIQKYLSEIVSCEKDIEVVKYYDKFNSAVEKVLSYDHLKLKAMTKDDLKKEIMTTFKSTLPIYR